MPKLKLFFRVISAATFALILVVPLAAQNNGAQQSQTQNNPNGPFPAAPIPSQILAAKEVFISNAPGETFSDMADQPNRTYDQFYAAIRSLQKYRLASSPAAADLIFEISITQEIEVSDGTSRHFFQLRLVIVDPKTTIPLWTITQPIEAAFRKVTAEKNFDSAMAQLINQLKQVTSPDAGGPAVK